jgi:putative hydrolase
MAVPMKIAIDTHTHSISSGHAYSTIDELAKGARRRGLKGFVLTDHGPAMPGGTHPYHFGNLRILPRRIGGVRFYRGIEANIMDQSGRIDIEPRVARHLDFVLAGFHEICYSPGDERRNTEALLAALANPLVDAISHPGNPAFPIDQEAVVKRAAELGKALEINDSSFRIRAGSAAPCGELARLAVSHGCPLLCGSDAHYWRDVGRFDTALAAITRAGATREQVLNSSVARFEAFISARAMAKQG